MTKKIFIALDILLIAIFTCLVIFAPKIYPYMPWYIDLICFIIAMIYYGIRAKMTDEPWFELTIPRLIVSIAVLIVFYLVDVKTGRYLDDNLNFVNTIEMLIAIMAGKLYQTFFEYNNKDKAKEK